ncbi:Translation factor guf1 mitochondrial [Naganishia albida]|nr:Translation factor guf1 mitochondrial [Naganishia albida]
MPHPSSAHATSRAALSALTCLRAFPRLRQRRAEVPVHSPTAGLSGGLPCAAKGILRTGGLEARRWAGSAALAVREEEEIEDVAPRLSREGSAMDHALEQEEKRGSGLRGNHTRGNGNLITEDIVDTSLSLLDARIMQESGARSKPLKRKTVEDRPLRPPSAAHPAVTRTAGHVNIPRDPSDPSPSAQRGPSCDRITDSTETDELVWDTEHILDQSLDSSSRRARARNTSRDLPWPTRHLRLRTVRPVDVDYAENAFHTARRRLSREDSVHRDVLMAHINHMLYLAARIPDVKAYSRIKAYLREHDLPPDSYTYLTRLILMDKMNQMNQLPGICRSFNERRVVSTPQAEQGRKRKTIDGEDATVLLNMTIWMLAKRAQWNIVGPAYNKLLIHTPHVTRHLSSAFPPDYFTPSHDVSFGIYFRNETALDKITYQSLIRALAFHGNIIPALAVMQDLLNDSRGYTVASSDFIALFQGFARFGRIPVGWEELGMTLGDMQADVFADSMASLRPGLGDDDFPANVKSEKATDRAMFPPPIFPEASRPGSSTSKMDALKHMTEIWAGKINTWERPGATMPTKLEREWTLVTLQQVFHSFLALAPVFDSPRMSTTSRKWWEPSLAEAPSPKNIFYIMLAFSRTTDNNVPVLRAVWRHLESKFGEGNEEGWTGWRLDARLRRLKEWLREGK